MCHFNGGRAWRAARVRLLTVPFSELPKWLRNGWTAARIIATPSWADMSQINKVYAEARRMTLRTGVKYTVDHIIPLRHGRVCGLHVANNLRVIPEKPNIGKGNYWCPEQEEMFEVPEQLTLF